MRVYFWQGDVYLSVTEVLRVIARPNLVDWAAHQVAQAALEDLRALALEAKKGRDEAIRWLVQKAMRDRDQAAAVGTEVHQLARAAAVGGPAEISKNSNPLARSFFAFLQTHKPRFLLNEVAVYNRQHRYAGTLDAVAVIGGRTLLLDYKTGRDIYREYRLQLAAYANADFVALGDGKEGSLPSLDGAAILHLRPDGFRLVEVRLTQEDFEAFLAALRIYRWMMEHDDPILRADLAGTVGQQEGPAPSGGKPANGARRSGAANKGS